MRRPFARFAVIGSIITVIDVGVFVALATHNVVIADAVAVALANVGSLVLHRAVTFRDDPYHRWLSQRRQFYVAGVTAFVVDLAVVLAIAGSLTPSIPRALIAKLIAVALGGTIRWLLHRRVLFAIVRSEQVPRPDRTAAPGDSRLSVVLPAYEEADRIADSIERVRAALGDVEIVVVDDGSPDATADVARGAGADIVVTHECNQGKGAAVRTGVLAAHGRTIAFTDADLSYSPDQVMALVQQVEAGWDVVVGSRKHDQTRTLVRARRLREIGGRFINWLTYSVLLGHYRDTQCGLKAFRSDVAREMFSRGQVDGFAFDVELFVMVERNGLALTEVPVTVTNTSRSTVNVVRDAGRLVRDLFRIRRRAREGAYQLSEPEMARQ
jgi:putative flippase GtrA